jgi:hypothetical protein
VPGSAPLCAHRPPAPLRLQHHRRAAHGRAPPWRRHHRHEHGQPRRGHAGAHRRQADRGGAAPRHPRLQRQQGHPAPAPRHQPLVPRPLPGGHRPRPRGHRHHRLQGRPGAPDAGHAGPRRHRAGARPELPHPHLRRGDRRRRHPQRAAGTRRGLFRRAGKNHPRQLPQAQDDGAGLSVSNPTAQCVELDFFERVVALARNTTSWSCTTWPMPTSCSTAGRRPASCRCRAPRTWRWSSSPSARATTWPAGASASWSAMPTWWHALARIKSYHDYGSFTPCRWRPSPRWKATSSA